MCMMVYLSSPVLLPLVPWDESVPGFHVTTLRPTHGVRRQFSNPENVHYVGSHETCGCGFQLGEYPDVELDAEDESQMRASLDAFADYLERHLDEVGVIEVFASWAGDECEPPRFRRDLTPADLRDDDFYFLDKELAVFVK